MMHTLVKIHDGIEYQGQLGEIVPVRISKFGILIGTAKLVYISGDGMYANIDLNVTPKSWYKYAKPYIGVQKRIESVILTEKGDWTIKWKE